jgi:hypothetical protein
MSTVDPVVNALLVERNPYPGLRPFEEHETDLFFGREREITDLLGRIVRRHFLAVLGSSGCGKSSLIKAGLIPSLKYEQLDDGDPAWRIAVMRPGANPITQLAIALSLEQALGKFGRRTEESALVMQTILRRGSLGIVEAVREASLPPEARLLVLVDQFEELFRFPQRAEPANADDEARAFVNLLTDAATQRDLPIYIVLTMRSEFLGQCASFPGLAEAITEGLYLLPNMKRDQLREVIQKPIALRNGQITERLVNRLLNDLGGNSDQLPILQHALMRLWAHWVPLHREGPMDLRHYEFIGELKGSLSAHAEKIYNEELKTERERELAEALFRSITETTAENQTVRRPTRLGIICKRANASPEEMKPVIDQFREEGRSFLMPPKDVKLDAETMIDISHESLIRQWGRLSGWAELEVKASKIYEDLKRSANSWNEKGREPSWLFSGARLAEAQEWASVHQNLLDDSPLVKEFLAASAEAQRYAGLLLRAEKWEKEGRDESLLLRGKEMREAEAWLAQAAQSPNPETTLVKKEVKALVSESNKANKILRRLKIGLTLAFVALMTALVAVISLAYFAHLQRNEAEKSAFIAKEQSLLARKEKERLKEAVKELKDYQDALTSLINERGLKIEISAQQVDNASNELQKSSSTIEERQSVRIRYFYKSADGKQVADSLAAIGYKVETVERVGLAPTNAIWWGAGIELKHLQDIVYALISNGVKIQYIGRQERFPGEVQIGGRPRSQDAPLWTVEAISTLAKLPVDNEKK